MVTAELAENDTISLLKTKNEFYAALNAAADQLVLVDFFATWCPPCKSMEPHFKAMEGEFPQVKFYKVDVDQNVEVVS